MITLAGLPEPIRSGITYPVIIEFERPGDILVQVPIDTPDFPRRASLPRSDDESSTRTAEPSPRTAVVRGSSADEAR